MTMAQRLTALGRYIVNSFRITRMFFISVVVLSIFPGAILYFVPAVARLGYAYLFLACTGAALLSLVPSISGSVSAILGIAVLGRRYRPVEGQDVDFTELAHRMGVQNVRFYLTDNPWIGSPFTNVFTRKIMCPSRWLSLPRLERRSIYAHELTHLKTGRRFGFEVTAAVLGTVGFTMLLIWFSRPAIPIIVEVAEVAFAFLAISYASWRNEYRADDGAAREVGPEPLISVFEQLQVGAKSDGSSLTHPALRSRIKRLMGLLGRGSEEKE